MAREDKNTAIYVAYEDCVPYDPATPEKNLLRAMLLGAMLDLNKPGEVGRHAVEYFLSSDEESLFSFQSVCSHLQVDPGKILQVTGLGGMTVYEALERVQPKRKPGPAKGV